MQKILIYIEPHPIRNYYEEFHDVGLLLCKAMYQAGRRSGYDFRFFSNDAVIDRIVTSEPNLSYLSLRMTAKENSLLENFFHPWDKSSIDQWTSLVRGEGAAAEFYFHVLERLHRDFEFTGVLLWSDNGAVRNFCKFHNIIALHAEYGPTRAPFHQTIYFDPQGTNGAAAVLEAPFEELTPSIIVPSETWVTRQGKNWNHESEVGLIDAPFTANLDFLQNFELPSPFIFIPLQLEDDLNTQLYSKFPTPEAFLRETIPEILESGLNVVVKGHPAAPARPYNLSAEIRALNYADSFGDRVKILPRNSRALDSVMTVMQSTAVATINSSVGFEALLLGKPVFLYGAALYNIKNALNKNFTNLQNANEHTTKIIDKLTSFLCNHYLHPIESVKDGRALIAVLDYIFANKNVSLKDPAFWEGWIRSIDFGYQWLTENNKIKYQDTHSLAGNRAIFEAHRREFKICDSKLQVHGYDDKDPIFAWADNKENEFIGFIDSIEHITENNQSLVQINGWCLERNSLRPPIQIFFCRKEKIISQHRLISERRDVAETLEMPIAARCGFTFCVQEKNFNPNECSLIFISSSNYAKIAKLQLGSLHQPISPKISIDKSALTH